MSKFLNTKWLMFLFFLGAPTLLIAQQVTGVVKDDSGALPGVSVVVKGTSSGTTTDFDGKYAINASNGAVLVFSYVGYETQENTVTENKMNVTMQSGVALDAVVLTGNRSKPRIILDSPVPIDNYRFR